MKKVTVQTRSRAELIDITNEVQGIVDDSKIRDGICTVFAPHTTAAITINENADPSVREDILSELNRLIPFNGRYRHTEGNAAAHIKSSIIGCSKSIIVKNGRLLLGTWQGVYFCEFDGPRQREAWIKLIPTNDRQS